MGDARQVRANMGVCFQASALTLRSMIREEEDMTGLMYSQLNAWSSEQWVYDRSYVQWVY